MTSAVLYARVSGDDRQQESRNLLGQLAMCRTYAEKRGYEIVAELHEDDRGASGAAFELPQLNLVREMAQRGEFTVLVTRELDRLSRSLAKQLLVEEELRRCAVQIEYVLGEYPDTPEGSLMKNVRASVAEYERLKINERMVRGRELKVQAGSVLVAGRPPFGYAVAEVAKKWTLIIDEEEAAVIRLIFEWYTMGDSSGEPLNMAEIKEKLTGLGVPTWVDRRGYKLGKKRSYGEWGKAQIDRILKCETYAGIWHWRKNGKTSTGRKILRSSEECLPVPVPAIISRETWELAQRQRVENTTNATRNLKHQYLLRRRLTCEHCKATVVAFAVTNDADRHYSYYRCAAARDKQLASYLHACTAPHFRADQVDQQVWHWVRSLLLDETVLRQGLDTLATEQQADRAPVLTHLQEIEGLLAEQQQQMKRLLDAYLTGLFPKEVVGERRVKLERRIAELENERARLNARLASQTLTPQQIMDLTAFATEIGSRLAQSAAADSYALQCLIIDALDVRARLAVKGDKKVMRIRCVLGQDELVIEPLTMVD